jgi:hypothetical protein
MLLYEAPALVRLNAGWSPILAVQESSEWLPCLLKNVPKQPSRRPVQSVAPPKTQYGP